MTTRFLLTCISAFYYDGDKTLDDLRAAIAEDAIDLFWTGVTVPLLQTYTIFMTAGYFNPLANEIQYISRGLTQPR